MGERERIGLAAQQRETEEASYTQRSSQLPVLRKKRGEAEERAGTKAQGSREIEEGG